MLAAKARGDKRVLLERIVSPSPCAGKSHETSTKNAPRKSVSKTPRKVWIMSDTHACSLHYKSTYPRHNARTAKSDSWQKYFPPQDASIDHSGNVAQSPSSSRTGRKKNSTFSREPEQMPAKLIVQERKLLRQSSSPQAAPAHASRRRITRIVIIAHIMNDVHILAKEEQ